MSDSFSINKKPQGITPSKATTQAVTTTQADPTTSSSDNGIGINEVYESFMNSISNSNDTERTVTEFAKAIGISEKIDDWLMATIEEYMKTSTGNESVHLGTCPMVNSSGDVITVNGSPLSINSVITHYNEFLAILNAQYTDFYNAAKAQNPNTLLPPKPNNMPNYLPTFGGANDPSSSNGVDAGPHSFTVNGVPYTYTAPPPLDSIQSNPQEALEEFQNAFSSSQSLQKNIFIEIAQIQRNINNAEKSLSSELKTIMAMITQVLNNI